MAGFEKVKLATGEFRGEYIQRRLKDGVAVKTIAAEINAPGFYSGPEGKTWPESVVYAEKRKFDALAKKAIPAVQAPVPVSEIADQAVDVAPEHEGVLTSEDMKEIQAEAAAQLRKEKRAQARKEALAKAKEELRREAKLAEQRGAARGDQVDVHIDLAPYAPNIVIDGEVFEHGRTYRRPRKVAAVLYEQMQRSWQHQEGLNGKNENAYRRTFEQRRRSGNPTAGVAGPVNGVVA